MTTGAQHAALGLPAPRRRTLVALGSVLGSALLVAACVYSVDARAVLGQLRSVDPRWLLAFFAVYVLQVLLLGLRWSAIARQLGVPLGWQRASAEYALSVLMNSVLPTGFAGDGYRAVRHARRASGHPFVRVLEVLALDRASGQLALLGVVLATAPLTLAAGLVSPRTAALAGLALLLGLWLASRWLRRASAGSRALGFLQRARALLLEPRRAAAHLPLSLLLTATLVLQLWLAARAAGIELDPWRAGWLGPLIILAASAPSFFGSWGVREGASALLFASAGLPSSAGVTVSILFGSFSLASALPGVAVMLFDRSPHARGLAGGARAALDDAPPSSRS